MNDLREIIRRLQAQANPANVEGMARFGINPHNTLGVSMPVLRKMAKELGKNHPLAMGLWDSGIHEARILAALTADPRQLDEAMMKKWVHDFDSWDVCDQVCINLFRRSPLAFAKAEEWAQAPQEFVKRAGFVMMATLSVHAPQKEDATRTTPVTDDLFLHFFPLIKKHADDERNMVKKAVNWALRQIGKRNPELGRAAIALAEEIKLSDSKAARSLANDALRELRRRISL